MVYTHIFRLPDSGQKVGIKLSTELINLLTAFKEKFGKDCYNELINSFSKDFEDFYLDKSFEIYNIEEDYSIIFLKVNLKEAHKLEIAVEQWFINNSKEELWISDKQIEEWNSADFTTREAIIHFQSEVFEKPDTVTEEYWNSLTKLEKHSIIFQISQNEALYNEFYQVDDEMEVIGNPIRNCNRGLYIPIRDELDDAL